MKSASLLVAFAFSFCCVVDAAEKFPPAEQLPTQVKLPNPLVMFDGKPVANKKDWFNNRRPELKELFQHYEYGYFPPPAKIKSKVEAVDKNCFGGKATLKLVTISFAQKNAPEFHLLLVVPNHKKNPAPVFLGLNFSGNYALVTNSFVPIPTGWVSVKVPGVTNNHATEAGRGKSVDVWAIEQSIERGYAVATIFCDDIQPDRTDATAGVRAVFHGSKNPDDDWGTIAAWAWGLERAVDYLETNKEINKKKIAVVGHSRLGKAAILAGAFDERIALVIPLQAGCGGTSPARGKIGESVQRINEHFPHWFCDEFKKFNEQPEKLPFDQHCLIALCAPRPVLLSNATEDTWADPEGQFEMLKAADKVYRLVGAEGVASEKMPEVGKLMDSNLGYYIRPGKHSMTKEDWKIFLDFADKHFGKTK
ncbi:MAG: alpha/beta hydrolase family protein [Limisphaerales bacterium]